jgi:hypothetical protein
MNEVLKSEIASVENVVIGEVNRIRDSLTDLTRQEASNRRLLIDLKQGQESLQKSISTSLRDFRIEEDKRISSYVRKSLDGHYSKVSKEADRRDEKERLKNAHGRVVAGGGQFSFDKQPPKVTQAAANAPRRKQQGSVTSEPTTADRRRGGESHEMLREEGEDDRDGESESGYSSEEFESDEAHAVEEAEEGEVDEERAPSESNRDMEKEVSEWMVKYQRYQPPPPPVSITSKTAPPKYPVRRRSASADRGADKTKGRTEKGKGSKKENDHYTDPNIERFVLLCISIMRLTCACWPGIDGTKLFDRVKRVLADPRRLEVLTMTSMISILPTA